MIATVRTVTSDLAARTGFDLCGISDLRMAVDEASVALVSHMKVDQELRCVFVLGLSGSKNWGLRAVTLR